MQALQQPYSQQPQHQQYFSSTSSANIPGASSWSGYPSLGSYSNSSSSCPACNQAFSGVTSGFASSYPSTSTALGSNWPSSATSGWAQQQPQQQQQQQQQFQSREASFLGGDSGSSVSNMQKLKEKADWKKRATRSKKALGGNEYYSVKPSSSQGTAGLSGISSALITAGVAGLVGNTLFNRATTISPTSAKLALRPQGAVPHFARLHPLTWQDASFEDRWTWQTYLDDSRFGRDKWAHERF